MRGVAPFTMDRIGMQRVDKFSSLYTLLGRLQQFIHITCQTMAAHEQKNRGHRARKRRQNKPIWVSFKGEIKHFGA